MKYRYEIDLRKEISAREKVSLINSTEPDMAKKLFAKYLAKAMGISEFDLRSMGTERDVVNVKDIIFSYVDFKTELLQNIKKGFEQKNLKVGELYSCTINWQGIEVTFGLGGLHGSASNQIVESDNEYIIKSLDVKSFYPNLAIKNRLHPAHLPEDIFCNLYENIYKERASIPKSDPRNYILKILLNSAYGMTNDKYSFLRDRQMTLSICINGQLLLAMLFESLLLAIPDSQLIMLNTDGGEIKIPREYEDMYFNICREWEKKTQLELEFEDYNKLILRDVNNYIGIFTNGKTKCKGAFEFENIPLHKNKSHSIIPRAVFNYFVNNISIEDTIYNHTNIYDFCAGVRARSTDKKGKCWYELRTINNEKRIYTKKEKRKILEEMGYYSYYNKDFYRHPDMQDNMAGIHIDDFQPRHEFIDIQKLSKTVRYFISKQGKWLYKCCEDGSYSHVEAPLNLGKMKKDWKVTYFNKYYSVDDFKDYNIDYSYYIHKAREWINNIQKQDQLKLF